MKIYILSYLNPEYDIITSILASNDKMKLEKYIDDNILHYIEEDMFESGKFPNEVYDRINKTENELYQFITIIDNEDGINSPKHRKIIEEFDEKIENIRKEEFAKITITKRMMDDTRGLFHISEIEYI